MIVPNFIFIESEFKYFMREGSASLAMKTGLMGHIILNEHAEILLISKSQCLSF